MINKDIPMSWIPNPEYGYIIKNSNLYSLSDKIAENGFIENYCLSEEQQKQLKLIRKKEL